MRYLILFIVNYILSVPALSQEALKKEHLIESENRKSVTVKTPKEQPEEILESRKDPKRKVDTKKAHKSRYNPGPHYGIDLGNI